MLIQSNDKDEVHSNYIRRYNIFSEIINAKAQVSKKSALFIEKQYLQWTCQQIYPKTKLQKLFKNVNLVLI